ncbi:MAG TPA: hypothetical protein VFX60_06260 [Micromonospora sp.]|nr:hypothetical protein [Micromonospora sp.]
MNRIVPARKVLDHPLVGPIRLNVEAGKDIQTNVNEQYALYGAGGDAVIDVFVAKTKGLTRDQILADAATIRSRMEGKINDVGPQKVSRHCADPNVVNVADISAGAFNSKNDKLFMNAIEPRVARLIDERENSNCFHIELD